jgi:hypothetical protein
MNTDLAGRRYLLQLKARRALIAARRTRAENLTRRDPETTALAARYRGTSWLPDQLAIADGKSE